MANVIDLVSRRKTKLPNNLNDLYVLLRYKEQDAAYFRNLLEHTSKDDKERFETIFQSTVAAEKEVQDIKDHIYQRSKSVFGDSSGASNRVKRTGKKRTSQEEKEARKRTNKAVLKLYRIKKT